MLGSGALFFDIKDTFNINFLILDKHVLSLGSKRVVLGFVLVVVLGVVVGCFCYFLDVLCVFMFSWFHKRTLHSLQKKQKEKKETAVS